MKDERRELFVRRFHGPPTHLVHAPGRVNLIGEHVDYAGFPVLPMAIDRGVTLLVRARDDERVTIASADVERGERDFTVSGAIEPFTAGDWGNYAKAALLGLVRARHWPRGFDAVLTSDLPAAAGLSSSSALVVAAALAGLPDAAETPVGRLELARLLADAEQYVGARGGGMDQAAILCGRQGCALHIRFAPLRVRAVRLPADWRFVVAHSLEEAPKSAGARDAYNARRAAVERGFSALAGPAAHVDSPADLARSRGIEELLAEGEARLPPEAARRVRHVLTEQRRVAEAVPAMEAGDAATFGRLMLASHASLRDDFDVSTPALDGLVEASMASGALGARLTGAGLGGCVVALVPRDREADLLAGLAEAFYAPRGVSPTARMLFVARSSGGARVTRL